MKKIVIVIVVVLALLVGVSLAKNVIAKTALSAGVKAVTGLGLKIGSLDVGVLKTRVIVKDLEIFNPSGFSDKVMADIPEIYVDYDLGAFLTGKVHLSEARFNLKEMVVVKNEKGALNLDSLKVVENQKKGAKEQKMPDVRIDLLKLKIGKVIYKDYSSGTPPQVSEFNINLDETYKDVADLQELASLIIFKALINTSISGITSFDLTPLRGGAKSAVNTTEAAVKEAGRTLKKSGKSIIDLFKK